MLYKEAQDITWNKRLTGITKRHETSSHSNVQPTALSRLIRCMMKEGLDKIRKTRLLESVKLKSLRDCRRALVPPK